MAMTNIRPRVISYDVRGTEPRYEVWRVMSDGYEEMIAYFATEDEARDHALWFYKRVQELAPWQH